MLDVYIGNGVEAAVPECFENLILGAYQPILLKILNGTDGMVLDIQYGQLLMISWNFAQYLYFQQSFIF